MSFDEFWFRRTLPQIFMLVGARIERNERSEESSKNDKPAVKDVMSMDDLMMMQQGFK